METTTATVKHLSEDEKDMLMTAFDHINEKEYLIIPKKRTLSTTGFTLEYNCHPGVKYVVEIVEKWISHPSGLSGKIKIIEEFKDL